MTDTLQTPPGQSLRPEGKGVPTHDEFGDSYDHLNAARGLFLGTIVSAIVLLGFIVACID
jgi:hypothetical protein